MGNPVTWFEINGPQPEQAASCYSEPFGRHTEPVEGGDNLIDTHAARGMNGGLGRPPADAQLGSIFYVQGPDIRALLDKAQSLGGKAVTPVTEIPDMVTYATFTDPWGNLIGLIKGDETDAGSVSDGDNPPVDWFELSCSEPKKAWDFYRALFGWTIEGSEGEEVMHGEINAGSGAVRGGIGSSRDGEPHMEVYASVDDLTKYLERAEGLGGKTVMPPMKVDEHTSIAMLADPQGTVFGLYASGH